ncbi:MAG TPA: efflux RND transporter periplasmic adaptor subunit [Telluria sp.]|nr:efflux RND transporter periplasmic adaptor subunit [Telluria sp.]
MRKLIFLVGTLVAVLFGLNLMSGSQASTKTGQPQWPVVQASRANLAESTVATGTVKSKVGAEVKVGSQISGVVSRLYVNVGDHVEKGQLLAELDDSALRARVKTQEAELEAAIAEHRYAQAELTRFEQLGPNIARIQLENSRRNVAVRVANIEQARARLADARIQLAFVRITAPISGSVASVSTYQGETVAASFAAPTFVTIVDLSRLEIQSYVDETDIGRVHAGQPVTFRLDAFPGKELSGVVRAIYPKPQLINNVVNYVVIVDITDKPDFLVRPDMTAHVNFVLAAKEHALSLPRAAVLTEGKQSYVLVREGGTWSKRAVGTGMRTTQRIEITNALKESDAVLADAQLWKTANKEQAQ